MRPPAMRDDSNQMNRSVSNNIIIDNSGETLVEVMVAFIVLMIVLATFSDSISFASSSITYSIDLRRTSDNEYIDFHSFMVAEKRTSTEQATTLLDNRVTKTANTETVTIPAIDSSNPDITLTAYQYKSGDTIYWVFK